MDDSVAVCWSLASRSVSCYTEYNSNDNDNDQTKRTSRVLLRSDTTSFAISSESVAEGASLSLSVESSVEESNCDGEEFNDAEFTLDLTGVHCASTNQRQKDPE